MSRSTGLPQHLLVVDLRQENAERIIGQARQAGLAVRTTRADSLELALRQMSAADLVILSFDGPADWSFESVMAAMVKAGHHPLVVADRLDDAVVARAYSAGAQGVLPANSADALVWAIRWGLSVAADRLALAKAEAYQAETATREETLLDTSRDPVAYIHEGMHIRANRAYMDFFGIEDAEEIESLPFLDLVDEAYASEAKVCLKAASKGDIPSAGIDLHLVSSVHGSVATHVEISKASYEGEPCLQLTLRTTPQAAPVLEAAIVAAPSSDKDLSSAWWERAAAIHETASTAAMVLVFIEKPGHMLSAVPVQLRNSILDEIESELWNRLSQTAGDRADRRALVNLGGAMFGLLLPCADAESAHREIKQFHSSLDFSASVGEYAVRPTFSISGVVIGSSIGWDSIAEATTIMEKGVDQASQSGGFIWFDPSTQNRAEMAERRRMADMVRAACQNEQSVILSYRPILPLAGNPTPIYEAFVRLRGKDGALLLPADFLPIVEESGLSSLLDNSVAGAARRALEAKPNRNGLKLILSVCPETINDDEAASTFIASVASVAQNIVVQVPASLIEARPERALQFRNMLKAKGIDYCVCRFGLDERSAGPLLDGMKPQWVKFDRQWSGDVLRQPDRQKVFRSLVNSSHAIGAHTIADFVKDSQSMSALFSSGVEHAGGDFLSPPLESMDADFSN